MKSLLKIDASSATEFGLIPSSWVLGLAVRYAALLLFLALLFFSVSGAPAQEPKTKDEKKEEKKPDAFKIQKLTQGMGLYAVGPVSPDRKSVLLLAHKPDAAPNLYLMNLGDHSIRPPLTNLKWGAADPQWSPDGQSIAFAGFNETAT